MPAVPLFTFIAGQDDYLVDRLGQKRFHAANGEAGDGLAGEIINGFAANVGEVEAAINRFREAVQTMPMFGGKCAVWLKDVNFLADTPTGRAESTLALLDDLKAILLQSVNPEETGRPDHRRPGRPPPILSEMVRAKRRLRAGGRKRWRW